MHNDSKKHDQQQKLRTIVQSVHTMNADGGERRVGSMLNKRIKPLYITNGTFLVKVQCRTPGFKE